jgi:hypothetical protein
LVVVEVCCAKVLGLVVWVATTKVEGTLSDVELMEAGSDVVERMSVVRLGVGLGVVVVVFSVVGVFFGESVVVLVVGSAGAMVDREVPSHPSGVMVVYTVR